MNIAAGPHRTDSWEEISSTVSSEYLSAADCVDDFDDIEQRNERAESVKEPLLSAPSISHPTEKAIETTECTLRERLIRENHYSALLWRIMGVWPNGSICGKVWVGGLFILSIVWGVLCIFLMADLAHQSDRTPTNNLGHQFFFANCLAQLFSSLFVAHTVYRRLHMRISDSEYALVRESNSLCGIFMVAFVLMSIPAMVLEVHDTQVADPTAIADISLLTVYVITYLSFTICMSVCVSWITLFMKLDAGLIKSMALQLKSSAECRALHWDELDNAYRAVDMRMKHSYWTNLTVVVIAYVGVIAIVATSFELVEFYSTLFVVKVVFYTLSTSFRELCMLLVIVPSIAAANDVIDDLMDSLACTSWADAVTAGGEGAKSAMFNRMMRKPLGFTIGGVMMNKVSLQRQLLALVGICISAIINIVLRLLIF